MFAFSTSLFLEEVEKHAPEVLEAFESSSSIEEAYEKAPEISIDYGVMEKTEKAAVVPLNVKWSDLGSFDAIYEVLEKDDAGNAVQIRGKKGYHIGVNSKNNLIMTERLTATVGVSDLVIIDTGDALLVAHRGDAEGQRDLQGTQRDERREGYRA